MVAVLQADELPQDVAGAEALLTSHSEHKAEIDARQDSFTSFKKNAEALIAAKHYASQEVVEFVTVHLFRNQQSTITSPSQKAGLGAIQTHLLHQDVPYGWSTNFRASVLMLHLDFLDVLSDSHQRHTR